MCGRLSCHLAADRIPDACKYKDACGEESVAPWVPEEFHRVQYTPSYNVLPRETVICLLSGSHFDIESERVLCPMKWGMIPHWYKDLTKHSSSTHNGRLESLANSRTYGFPLKQEKRCAVVVNGFYEWRPNEVRTVKQPYYVYKRTPRGDDEEVLYLAGLFDKWTSEDDDSISMYSCTIITKPANEALSWLHERAPVILQTEKDVEGWLNNKDVSTEKAIAKLISSNLSTNSIQWHPVTDAISHYKNKDKCCTKPTEVRTMEDELEKAWLNENPPYPIRKNPKIVLED